LANLIQRWQYFQGTRIFLSALRIQLYYDDVVVNNPLSSKFIHVSLELFILLQNIPQHLNSFLDAIHVLTLCNTTDIDKYGMEAVLAPFLRDLKLLESDNGVITIYNGSE